MSKTPEQMAQEYAVKQHQGGWEVAASKDGFLAGYKAAKLESMRPVTDTVGDALSADAIQCARRLLGPKPTHYAIFTPSNTPDPEEPDTQEQLEALQQYMTVAQQKIMALQHNVDFLLWLMKDRMGDEECKRRMAQVMQKFGRRE